MKTPLIYDKALWETSGHWEKFRENMFLIPLDDEHAVRAQADELPRAHAPLRERPAQLPRPAAPVRGGRAAPSQRARGRPARPHARAARDPGRRAHLLHARSRSRPSSTAASSTLRYLYDLFGLEARAELSTRPDNKLGTDEEWDFTEGELQAALERHGIDYVVSEGEGSFYGPKIDLHMTDVLGRSWQLGTIQLDRADAGRGSGSPTWAPTTPSTPSSSSTARSSARFERFIGILIEHYGGAFPFWLAPVQVRVLPVGEAHGEAAAGVAARLREAGFRVDVGEATETIGKRIRSAELEKIPYVIVYGDRESDESLAVREHGGGQETLGLVDFIARLATLEA